MLYPYLFLRLACPAFRLFVFACNTEHKHTRNPNKRSAADPRLRPLGHWNRLEPATLRLAAQCLNQLRHWVTAEWMCERERRLPDCSIRPLFQLPGLNCRDMEDYELHLGNSADASCLVLQYKPEHNAVTNTR